MPIAFLDAPPERARRVMPSADDAVEIWLARWMRIRQKDILARYGCDPRRLYEIWEGRRHPESREKALAILRERFPSLADRVDLGHHRRLPSRTPDPAQLSFLE